MRRWPGLSLFVAGFVLHPSAAIVAADSVARGAGASPYATAQARVRGIVPRPVDPNRGDGDDLQILPVAPRPEPKTAPAATTSALGGAGVRIAAVDGQTSYFASLAQQAPVIPVSPDASPDLLWNPATGDVSNGADVIARNVDANALAGVVDRTLALAWLKRQAARGDQPVRLLAGEQVHQKGGRVAIEASQLAGRYLVLFSLSGDGSVQMLYPLGSDPPQRDAPAFRLELQVREPFGADELVAVSSSERLAELERLLKQTSRRVNPDRLAETLTRKDVRIGTVGINTTP